MYAVVGCNNCSNIWLLSDPRESESAQCSRCRKRHQTTKLKHLFESEDRETARQARSEILAKKQGDTDMFADVDHVTELEAEIDTAVIDDKEYLESTGIDSEAVADAGETNTNTTGSHEEIIREAVKEAGDNQPSESEIIEYARSRGVPEQKASTLLEKLCQQGGASKHNGQYRLI